jgi:uncharacterized protein YidB (DUF937 family)
VIAPAGDGRRIASSNPSKEGATMGLLDDLLASVTAPPTAPQTGGRPTGQQQPQAGAGGPDMSRILMALMPIVLAMLAGRRGGQPQAQSGGGGGFGGLGDLLGSLLGGTSGGGQGGLGDLLGQLQRVGYGEQADSWVGRGQNQPLPANAIEQIFGRGGLSEIARRAGLSETDTSRGLSQLLPEVVDRVTPEGQVPEADTLLASVQALGRRYGVA